MTEETISRTIKKENWDVLSVTEQAMAKKMGFKPASPTKPKTPPKPRQQKAYATLKEYHVIAHIKCKLCGHLSEEAYHMKAVNYDRKKGEPHLRAHGCTVQEARQAGAKRELHSRPYCIVCKTRLLEKTKEELIEKLLNKAHLCECKWR
jgi:hypothetical protein